MKFQEEIHLVATLVCAALLLCHSYLDSLLRLLVLQANVPTVPSLAALVVILVSRFDVESSLQYTFTSVVMVNLSLIM